MNLLSTVCFAPDPPIDGSLVLTNDGWTVEYSCDAQTTLSGEVQRNCSQTGFGWSGNDPVCSKCMIVCELSNLYEPLLHNSWHMSLC